MENINIKVILYEVFGKSCDSITCDTFKKANIIYPHNGILKTIIILSHFLLALLP